MRYTINFDCKTHHIRKDGTIPMLLRVSINGEQTYLNLGKKIKISHYDTENKCVKAGINGFAGLTSFIDRQRIKVDNIITEHEKKEGMLNIHRLKELYEQDAGNVKSISFIGFVEETIKRERELGEIDHKTLNCYACHLKKLKKYKPKLSIHDITKSFLEEYKSYIITVLKHTDNTAYITMTFIRKYTKKLFRDGKISKYPFLDFSVGNPFEVNPSYLEPEELNKLHELYESKELEHIKVRRYNEQIATHGVGMKYQNVLRYYLASCYCGLRHSDISTLRTDDIQGNFIVKEMQKGRLRRKKTIRIPIRKKLLSLLNTENPNQLVFDAPVFDNKRTNEYLKAIAEKAGIHKPLSFHSARHTFAINSLILGIKIEVVGDILGHSKLTTTQRYARVVDTLREQEMNKWDKLAIEENTEKENIVCCPNCENTVLKFERNVIGLNKLPLVCPFCSASFLYNLKESAIQLKKPTAA
jgi:integrase